MTENHCSAMYIVMINSGKNDLLYNIFFYIIFGLILCKWNYEQQLCVGYIRRRKWQPTPVLLPGKSHGWRNLVGCHLWGLTELDTTEGVAESSTRLSDFTFTFHFLALKKETAIHSSVLAWRIPRMEEPGGLPSVGSHRVRHDWSDLAAVLHLERTFYFGKIF